MNNAWFPRGRLYVIDKITLFWAKITQLLNGARIQSRQPDCQSMLYATMVCHLSRIITGSFTIS